MLLFDVPDFQTRYELQMVHGRGVAGVLKKLQSRDELLLNGLEYGIVAYAEGTIDIRRFGKGADPLAIGTIENLGLEFLTMSSGTIGQSGILYVADNLLRLP